MLAYNRSMQNLIFFGAAIQIVGIWAYIRDMLRGRTKPNRITWLGWATSPLIAAAAALSSGAGWSVLPTFMTGLLPLIVFTLSFFVKKAYWKLGHFDYFCGIFSVLALVSWYLTSNPAIAVVFAILADGSAALPTIVKAWKHPETETPLAYFLGVVAVLTTFAAVSTVNFASLGFPVYLVIINSFLTFETVRRRVV
jgi:hypothetical protein